MEEKKVFEVAEVEITELSAGDILMDSKQSNGMKDPGWTGWH